MGLRNQPEYAAQFEQAEVETSTETTTATKTENTVQDTKTQDTKAQADTAIAQAQSRAVTTPSKKMQLAFAEQQNVFDTATVEGLSLASPRLKGEQGSIFKGDEDLGSKIRFELVSWNKRWAIGTGSDDKEARDYFKVSYDGETVSGDGSSVADYLESLRAQGFDKARMSPYGDLWGFITWTETKGDIPADERELCILQCSQTSLGAFVSFCTTRGLLESKGLVQPVEVIEVTAMKRQNGANRFTNFAFSAPKA